MTKKRQASSPKFVLGVAIVCILASGYPLYVAWEAHELGKATEPSTCEILSKGVEESSDSDGGNTKHYPVVEIAHTIDGKRYTRKDSGKLFGISSDAINATAHLKVGDQVPCHYVPGSPEHVVVLEQNPRQVMGMLIFAGFLWLMPIGMFAWERKQPGWRGP